MLTFQKASWIWMEETSRPDTYADFMTTFTWNGQDPVYLKISADSNYAAYLNGQLATFGQYADYPTYKVGDRVEITPYLRRGSNTFAAIVWYYGVDSFTYLTGNAGLIFEIETAPETVLAYSSPDTLCREDPGYVPEQCHLITGQLGLGFTRDETTAQDTFLTGDATGFHPACPAHLPRKIHTRPIEKLILKDRMPSRIVTSGTFTYPKGDPQGKPQPAEYLMQHAALTWCQTPDAPWCQISEDKTPEDNQPSSAAPYELTTTESCDGLYVILDLGQESVGFLDLDLELETGARIDIGWGEHLVDGRCRTAIRGFSVEYRAKAGRNRYLNPFRRFGCRYLQLFIHSKKAKIHYAGIRPTEYPVNKKQFHSGSLLRDTIYEVCQHTLLSCMHEHYEDCPWREQSLYTMDSRNQMLCGYYTFGEKRFPRASLRLIAEGLQDYGLLSICYPANGDLCIPSFSAMYFVQMQEYIDYTGDTSLAALVSDTMERLIHTFIDRIDETGLIPSFYGDSVYWNFYEWSETLDGSEDRKGELPKKRYEAMLNADVSLALESYARTCRALGNTLVSDTMEGVRTQLNRAIYENFYDEKSGYFITAKGEERIALLTNAVCILCGAADGLTKEQKEPILQLLATNGAGTAAIPNTLSMNSFRYDALIREDKERFAPIILEEIDRTYLYMLRQGATTFWETIKGDADFENAGSLCHGWSALPIYYYETLL